MQKLKENVIAFIGAIILTALAILLINNSNILSTDILGQKKITSADLQAKVQSGVLLVVSNKNIENVASMTMQIAYNPEKLHLTKNDFDSPYNLAMQQISTGNLFLVLTNINMIEAGDLILKIKGITKNKVVNINFGNIKVIDNNGRELDLTISK